MPNFNAMTTALAGQNPYVTALLLAMLGSNGWASGTVQGMLHDAYYDATIGRTSYGVAIPFTGTVSMSSAGLAQIEIAVGGDPTSLNWLQQYSTSMAVAAVPPISVAGTIGSGGLHGALQVVGVAGLTQAIQW